MLEKTWRWFGVKDVITLEEIRQIGIEGIVTALHHIPNGEVWTCDEVNDVKAMIERHGMRWSVVESLPVHEAIKYGGANRDQLIENYKQSLVNLGECGIDTVCYNFMPVIDWIRTSLHHKLDNGAESLYFNLVDFVVFDRYILARGAAEFDYPQDVVDEAAVRYQTMSLVDQETLIDTIIVKTQGFIDGITADEPWEAVRIFKQLMANYEGIGREQLRQNLKYFLQMVTPVAEQCGIKLCIHPDDPPFPVLGLPRIVSSRDDLQWLFEVVPSSANGLTFCAGSLSAGSHNDLNEMVDTFANRIYFAHLRSTQRLDNGDFYEASHLGGSADLFKILKTLLQEQKGRKGKNPDNRRIPMRVDHGHRLLHDFNESHNPGYPLIGRLKAVSEINGLEMGIELSIANEGK